MAHSQCTSEVSESKISNTCEKHIEGCGVGDEDWLVQNIRTDSPAMILCPSTNQSGEDEFDYGALLDRFHQILDRNETDKHYDVHWA